MMLAGLRSLCTTAWGERLCRYAMPRAQSKHSWMLRQVDSARLDLNKSSREPPVMYSVTIM